MKKKTVLFLLPAFAFALAAAPVLTSCSDDEGNDDPGFGSPEKLAAPTNIRLDEAERTLRWDAVPHAASYTIYRNLLGGLAAPAAEGVVTLSVPRPDTSGSTTACQLKKTFFVGIKKRKNSLDNLKLFAIIPFVPAVAGAFSGIV